MSKPTIPAVEGWFDPDPAAPRLIGTRCTSCGSYFFPKQSFFCRNPRCSGEELEEVRLSERGTIWSYTNSAYAPPEPFVAPDPYEPFAIAAVRLEREGLVVLGQMATGVAVSDLSIGQEVELVVETLFEDDEATRVVWKWKPL